MKIGFSFGRCVRDIVNGTVDYDDVYLIVARTLIHDSSHVDDVIAQYLHEPNYLLGLDEGQCYDVGQKLYLGGKLYQPRKYGHRPVKVAEDAVWMDLMPCVDDSEALQSEQVVAAWRQYQLALKMTTLKQYPKKHEADRLKDDF
jgi:hypothetical protein